jgi:hypothetical protein
MSSLLVQNTYLTEMLKRAGLWRRETNLEMSCVDGSCIARVDLMVWGGGRVQSCVRPVGAVHMTAGPDGMRG